MQHLDSPATLRGLALALGLLAGSAQALEAHPGDAVAPPPGTSLFGLYSIHQRLDSLKVGGQTVAGPELRVDVGLLRLFHATRFGDWQVNPQLVMPYGKVSGAGALSGTPSKAGLGDLSLMASVMLRQDAASRTSVYLLPGVTLPTGDYRNDRLSLGENRHKVFVQLGGQTALSPQWTVDGYADVTLFGANKRNPGGRLTQKPELLLQGYLRYAVSPATELAAGLRHYSGGETSVAGAAQDDRERRTAMLLTASHWVDGKTQLMANWGRDLSHRSGFKASQNVELRMIRMF